MPLRLLRTLAPAALALLLTACGGGADEAPVEPVLRDTQVLSAAGGTLTVDGASLALPADAVPAGTELTLEQLPADAAAGELLHLRLTPAGQRLAVAAELAVDLPAAPADTQAFWDVGGDLVLAPSTRSGDRFTLRLDSLGFDGDGRRLAPAAADASARRRALAAASPAGGDLKLQVQDCQAKARALTRRLAAMLQRDAIDEAQLLSSALEDLVQRCQALEVQQAQAEACTQQAAAVAAIQQSAPPTLADLDKRVRDLLGTTDSVRKVLATCPAAPDVSALLRASIEQYTRLLKADLDAGRLEGPAGARELSRLFAVDADCQLLGLDEACIVLRTEVFPAVLDGMRADAFAECRERGSSLPVSQLIDLGVFTGRDGKFIDFARYTTADLELDAAMCTGPELQVRVFGSDDPLDDRPDLDTRIVALGALGQYTQRAEVRPPRAGRLLLDGAVKVTRCPDGTALGAELVVRLTTDDNTGAVLARRPHDGTLFNLTLPQIDLSVPQILATAGLDPATATGASVTLTQEGGACTSLLDEDKQVLTEPVRLFRLDLALAAADAPSLWSGSITVNTVVTASLRGSRVAVPSTFQLNSVSDTTTEAVNLSFSHSRTLTVPPGTDLRTGSRISLDSVAATSDGGTGSASVDSELTFTFGGCIVNRNDRVDTSLVLDLMRGGGTLEVPSAGQLRISAGGLAGAYRIVGLGDRAGDNNCGFNPRSFSQAFGPETIGGEDFLRFNDVVTTTDMPEGSDRVSGSAVIGNTALGSSDACHTFLRQHLNPLETRLFASEHEISCTQRTTLSWQLQRE